MIGISRKYVFRINKNVVTTNVKLMYDAPPPCHSSDSVAFTCYTQL